MVWIELQNSISSEVDAISSGTSRNWVVYEGSQLKIKEHVSLYVEYDFTICTSMFISNEAKWDPETLLIQDLHFRDEEMKTPRG